MALNKFLPNKTLVWKEWRNNWVLISLFGGFITYMSSFKLIKEILDYMDLFRRGVFEGQEFTYIMIQTDNSLK